MPIQIVRPKTQFCASNCKVTLNDELITGRRAALGKKLVHGRPHPKIPKWWNELRMRHPLFLLKSWNCWAGIYCFCGWTQHSRKQTKCQNHHSACGAATTTDCICNRNEKGVFRKVIQIRSKCTAHQTKTQTAKSGMRESMQLPHLVVKTGMAAFRAENKIRKLFDARPENFWSLACKITTNCHHAN